MTSKEYNREWYRRHPGYHKAWRARRRATVVAWRKGEVTKLEGYKRYLRTLDGRRNEVIKSLGGKCYICLRPTERLELHHLSYINGNPYKEYNTQRGKQVIVAEAKAHPENFRLLCNPCHGVVTFYVKHKTFFPRLAEVVSETWV